jgi:hypothetical protein
VPNPGVATTFFLPGAAERPIFDIRDFRNRPAEGAFHASVASVASDTGQDQQTNKIRYRNSNVTSIAEEIVTQPPQDAAGLVNRLGEQGQLAARVLASTDTESKNKALRSSSTACASTPERVEAMARPRAAIAELPDPGRPRAAWKRAPQRPA